MILKVTCFINCIRTLSLIKKHCLETICSISFRISVKPCPWPIEDIRRPIARLSPHIAPECNRSSHSSDFDSVVGRSLFSKPLKFAIIKAKEIYLYSGVIYYWLMVKFEIHTYLNSPYCRFKNRNTFTSPLTLWSGKIDTNPSGSRLTAIQNKETIH